MKSIDWTPVYISRDIDNAVDCFTEMFSYVLDFHAPWIRFQKRKHFSPSLTASTLELIKQRDTAKRKFEALARSSSGCDPHAKTTAWNEFKKLRNKINNLKNMRKITT